LYKFHVTSGSLQPQSQTNLSPGIFTTQGQSCP